MEDKEAKGVWLPEEDWKESWHQRERMAECIMAMEAFADEFQKNMSEEIERFKKEFWEAIQIANRL